MLKRIELVRVHGLYRAGYAEQGLLDHPATVWTSNGDVIGGGFSAGRPCGERLGWTRMSAERLAVPVIRKETSRLKARTARLNRCLAKALRTVSWGW